MYKRAQLPVLLGQNPTHSSGLNGTFELTIDLILGEDLFVLLFSRTWDK